MIQRLHQREVIRPRARLVQRGVEHHVARPGRGRHRRAGVTHQRAVAQDREAHRRTLRAHPRQTRLRNIKGHAARRTVVRAPGDVQRLGRDRGRLTRQIARSVAVVRVATQAFFVHRTVHRRANGGLGVGQVDREGRRLGVAVPIRDRVGEGLGHRAARRNVRRRGVEQVVAADRDRAALVARGNRDRATRGRTVRSVTVIPQQVATHRANGHARSVVIQRRQQFIVGRRRRIIVHRQIKRARIGRPVGIHDGVAEREVDVVLVVAIRVLERLMERKRVGLRTWIKRQREYIRFPGACGGGERHQRGATDYGVTDWRLIRAGLNRGQAARAPHKRGGGVRAIIPIAVRQEIADRLVLSGIITRAASDAARQSFLVHRRRDVLCAQWRVLVHDPNRMAVRIHVAVRIRDAHAKRDALRAENAVNRSKAPRAVGIDSQGAFVRNYDVVTEIEFARQPVHQDLDRRRRGNISVVVLVGVVVAGPLPVDRRRVLEYHVGRGIPVHHVRQDLHRRVIVQHLDRERVARRVVIVVDQNYGSVVEETLVGCGLCMRLVIEQGVGVSHLAGGRVVPRDLELIAQPRGDGASDERVIGNHFHSAHREALHAIRGADGEIARLDERVRIRCTAVRQVGVGNRRFAALARGREIGDQNTIIGTVNRDRERRRAHVAVSVAHRVLENLGQVLALDQGLHRREAVVQLIAVGAVRIERNRAICRRGVAVPAYKARRRIGVAVIVAEHVAVDAVRLRVLCNRIAVVGCLGLIVQDVDRDRRRIRIAAAVRGCQREDVGFVLVIDICHRIRQFVLKIGNAVRVGRDRHHAGRAVEGGANQAADRHRRAVDSHRLDVVQSIGVGNPEAAGHEFGIARRIRASGQRRFIHYAARRRDKWRFVIRFVRDVGPDRDRRHIV